MNSWLISLAVACAVIILVFGFAGLMIYLDKTLTAEQKEKISVIANIILVIIAIIVLLVIFTLGAHILIFDLRTGG